MKLKELFALKLNGWMTLNLVESGVEYQCSEGYMTMSEKITKGDFPQRFSPYADAEVVEIYPTNEHFASRTPDKNGHYQMRSEPSIAVSIIGTPSENICEIFYTGGGIWCGVVKLSDGWFMGECNDCGGIWKTYSQALEAYAEEGCGFVRDVYDVDELKRVWTQIYNECINRGTYDDVCKELLNRLDEDICKDMAY